MADPLFPNPSDAEGPAAWIVREQRSAQSSALQGLDANADDGARAIELGNATGADPAVVHGNLDQFEQQHKAALTSQLLQSNQFLRDYANSHSMAPIVSNDDWGQLDLVSQRVQNLVGSTAGRLLNAPGDIAESAVKAFAEPFKRGFGEGIIDRPGDKEFQQSHPYLYATLANLALTADIPVELFNRTIEGVLGAGGAALETGAQALGASPESAADIKQAALATADTLMLMGMTGQAHVAEAGAAKPKAPPAVDPGFEKFYQAVKPYLEQGEKPPVGIDPIIDKLYSEQAKIDMKNLDEVVKEAGKSSTRERAPELFENFIRQHTDAKIGIDAEAVRKLYGDKQPEPGDGILGDVPGLADQLALAEAHGGDVEVPLATWIAKIEPEVAKELHDSIRVRPGGMTLEEAKAPKAEAGPEPKAGEEVAPPTAIDTIARAAGLRPEGWDEHLEPEERPSLIPDDADLGKTFNLGSTTINPSWTFPASSILKNIDPAILNPLPREIYTFLKPMMDKLAGEVPVHIVSTVDMQNMLKEISPGIRGAPGLHVTWDNGFREIFLDNKVVDGTYGQDFATHIIMHEIAHGATVRAIDQVPVVKEAIRALMNETDKRLSAEDRKEHNYAFKNEAEFVAEAFSKQRFQEVLASTPMTPELAKALGIGKGPKTLWDAFREMVRSVLEKVIGKPMPDTILDGVLQIGKIVEQLGNQAGGDGFAADAGPRQPDLPGIVKPEGVFDRPSALGMNKERATRYRELIKRQQDELAEAATKERQDLERERQTKEWKENYGRVRAEVAADLKNRPDIAADRFLRLGELYGEKTKKVPLDREQLTPEQIKGLPKDYIAAEGMHPDDVAGLFGYSTGDALVGALSRLEAERQLEGSTPQAHYANLVNAETERQMRKTYGGLEKNILDEAKDHVLSPTQMDILHEEMVALGEKAGGPKGQAISKEDIKAWVKGEFDKTPVGSHSTDKYLAAAGRAGQAAEDGLLKGDAVEAYKAKQQQVIAFHLATLAKKLEKETASYDRLAKRYSKREIAGVPSEFTNWVHDILMRTGNTVRRSVQDLRDAIGRETHDSLEDFVQAHNADARIWADDPNAPSDFQVMPVAEFLFDPAYRREVEEMTPPEFRAVANSVKTLIKNGQDERKVNVKGEKRDLAEVIQQMVGQLTALFQGKERQYAFGHKDEGILHGIRTYWASLLQIESIFNRFDRGDPKGIFRKVVTGPIFEGSHDLNSLETKYAREYRGLKFEKADLEKKVENTLFGDPIYGGEKRPMTRGNLLAVLQNAGNEGQLSKLAWGYGVKDPNAIMQWLFANTKKEDWDRAQLLGDIFERAFEESATMYHGLSGVAPEKISIQPIQTPFGEYRGWYHPLVYDPLRPGSSKKLMGSSPLEDGSYFRAATPSGYTKRRTGYAAPIQLNFDAIPTRLKSMLNDIAMRPAVTEVAKVFYDKDFQMAMTKYYGKEIKDLLLPYLKDVAGMAQQKDAALTGIMKYLELARQNVSATLIGLNPSTVMKHAPTAAMLSIKEVGPAAFLRELRGLLSMNDELGEKNWNFAMKGGIVDGEPWGGSEELQRRHRNWQETLSGAQADVFGENTLRQTAIKFGATPVAFSDLLSAVPTWLAAYKDQIGKGEPHGDAVAFADTAVRRAHGSSAIAAKPALMRSPIGRWAAPFYTFFNEMLQRQYEMAWRAKDALGEFKEGEYRAGLKELPNLMGGLWAYVVFPALIEQAVSPLITGQESTTEKVLTYGARTLGSGIPILRDMIEAWLGNRDPTIGLYSTGAKMLGDAVKDFSKGQVSFSKQHAGTTIKHTFTAFGMLSGLTNAQEGRTGEFMYNYATGKERPRNAGEVLRGLWHGQTKEPKR